VSYFYPQVNSSTLILFLNLWFRRFQTFRYRADIEHGDAGKQLHFYTVTHNINIKFSIALIILDALIILEGLIEPVIKRTVEFKDLTANSVMFLFETNTH
jgi:hypothetical protein